MMTKTNIYKPHILLFCAISQRFRDGRVSNWWPWKCRWRSLTKRVADVYSISNTESYHTFCRRLSQFTIYKIYKLLTLKIDVKVTPYNIRNGANRCYFLFDCCSNGCPISHNLRDIRKSLKMQNLTLKIKVKVTKEKNVNLPYATVDVQLHIANFFTILISGKLRLRKLGHTYTQRGSGPWLKAKIRNTFRSAWRFKP